MIDGQGTTQAAPPTERCSACGAPLLRDQEWCLECGAARTAIKRAPSPWLGVLIVVVAIAVVAAVAALAFS